MFVLSKSYLKLRLDLYVWCLSRFINIIVFFGEGVYEISKKWKLQYYKFTPQEKMKGITKGVMFVKYNE